MAEIYHPRRDTAAPGWDPYVPDEFDQDFGLVIMTLSFFATPTLARAFVKGLGRTDLAKAATLFRRAFPDAVAKYADRTVNQQGPD
jgi:hypothetical protein